MKSANGLDFEKYAHLTPMIIQCMEAFLELQKRTGTVSSSIQLMSTKLVRWLFDGYLNKMLHTQLANWTIADTLEAALKYLLHQCLWPNGQLFTPSAPVDIDEMKTTRDKVGELMNKAHTLLPDAVLRMIGRRHMNGCVVRLFRFLQQNVLIQHLVYTCMDDLIHDLFPPSKSRHHKRMMFRRRVRTINARNTGRDINDSHNDGGNHQWRRYNTIPSQPIPNLHSSNEIMNNNNSSISTMNLQSSMPIRTPVSTMNSIDSNHRHHRNSSSHSSFSVMSSSLDAQLQKKNALFKIKI